MILDQRNTIDTDTRYRYKLRSDIQHPKFIPPFVDTIKSLYDTTISNHSISSHHRIKKDMKCSLLFCVRCFACRISRFQDSRTSDLEQSPSTARPRASGPNDTRRTHGIDVLRAGSGVLCPEVLVVGVAAGWK